MAETSFQSLYLEAVEGTSGKNPQPDDSGHSEILCAQMGLCTRLLECGRKSDFKVFYNKQETRTSRIL